MLKKRPNRALTGTAAADRSAKQVHTGVSP